MEISERQRYSMRELSPSLSIKNLGKNPRSKIESEKIVCVMPTMNRRELLKECLDAYGKSVRCPTHMFVVDSSDEGKTLAQKRASKLIGDSHTVEMLYDNPKKHGGLGAARHYGCKMALEHVPKTDFLLNMDDDVLLKPDAVERMVAVLKQVPEIGSVGAMFAIVRFMKARGRKNSSVQVTFSHYGCHFLVRSCIVKARNFHPAMRMSEDYEMLMNAIDEGYWTSIVDSKAVHKQPPGSASHVNEATDGLWWKCMNPAMKRHPRFRMAFSPDGTKAMVKLQKGIKYPKERIEIEPVTLKALYENGE